MTEHYESGNDYKVPESSVCGGVLHVITVAGVSRKTEFFLEGPISDDTCGGNPVLPNASGTRWKRSIFSSTNESLLTDVIILLAGKLYPFELLHLREKQNSNISTTQLNRAGFFLKY
ncbi:unnamed protein product [Gongylonema pulchrum]|uniref:Uncharacterized protein n=1 Tax=Gongylonema pulchrum TaxID=637853 RepID=A0A183EE85_9BILA|nr:unnamed protein product [Gongylonema pulchrum]